MEQARLPDLLDKPDDLLPSGGRDQRCIIKVRSRRTSGDCAFNHGPVEVRVILGQAPVEQELPDPTAGTHSKSTLPRARISVAMTDSPARPLILTSGLLLALFDLVALLPGNPVVTSVPGFLVVVAVQALIIWRLWHRSDLAWFIGVFVPALYAVGSILVGGSWETTLVVTCFLAFTQAALLCTPPVLVYVWGRDETLASH
jgi:hypothetical protein